MFYLRYIINGMNGTKNYQLEAFPVLRNKNKLTMTFLIIIVKLVSLSLTGNL